MPHCSMSQFDPVDPPPSTESCSSAKHRERERDETLLASVSPSTSCQAAAPAVLLGITAAQRLEAEMIASDECNARVQIGCMPTPLRTWTPLPVDSRSHCGRKTMAWRGNDGTLASFARTQSLECGASQPEAQKKQQARSIPFKLGPWPHALP